MGIEGDESLVKQTWRKSPTLLLWSCAASVSNVTSRLPLVVYTVTIMLPSRSAPRCTGDQVKGPCWRAQDYQRCRGTRAGPQPAPVAFTRAAGLRRHTCKAETAPKRSTA